MGTSTQHPPSSTAVVSGGSNTIRRRDSGGSSSGTNFLTNNNVTVRGRCSPVTSCGHHNCKKEGQGTKIADGLTSSFTGADNDHDIKQASSDEKVDATASASAVSADSDEMDMDVEELCAEAEEGFTSSEDDHMMSSLENIHRNHARSAYPAQAARQMPIMTTNRKPPSFSHSCPAAFPYPSSNQAAAVSSAASSCASASSPNTKALQSMQRILNLNQSAINHYLITGDDDSWALDALHKAEWIRCHLADELALVNHCKEPAKMMMCYSVDRHYQTKGLSNSFTSGATTSASSSPLARPTQMRRGSFDTDTTAAARRQQQQHPAPLENVARTSYIYQRMDFDEGMHSFVNLEAIDPASFWLPIGSNSSSQEGMEPIMYDLSPVIEATLVFNVGQVHRRKGDLDAASKCYDRSLEILQSSASGNNSMLLLHRYNVNHPILIPILHNIGQLQYRRGDIHVAMETYKQALQCAQLMYGTRHPHVASALNCLGVLHYHDANSSSESDTAAAESNSGNKKGHVSNDDRSGRSSSSSSDNSDDESDESNQQKQQQQHKSTQKAMDLFQQALTIRMDILGPNHVDVATALNNIGRIHVQLDEFDAALNYYEDALRIRLSILGPDSLDYAATAFNAGQSFHQKGELSRAAELYHEFLRVALMKFGHSHRDVAVVLSGIAQIHQEKKEYDKALELYEASLCAGRAALGEDHSEIAMLLNRMGNFHFEQERLDDALRCYKRGLRIERRVLPPDHPNIVVTLSNLGEIHRQRNEWDEAAKMYGDCLDILMKKHEKEDHIDVASTLSTIGLIHDQRGDTCLSLHYLQDALLMRRRLLGNDHLDVSATLVYIGTILYRKGVFSVAIELFSESLRIRQAALGKDHRDVAFVLYNIALVHQQRGCYEEAIESYSETLRIEKLVLGEAHRDVSMTLFKLGEVNKAAGDLDEALKCFQSSLSVERNLSPSGGDVVAASSTTGTVTVNSASEERRQQQQQQQQTALGQDHAAMARALNEIGNIHLARGEVVPMMKAFNEASRLYRTAGLSPNNVVVIGHLYALEFSCPEAAPAA